MSTLTSELARDASETLLKDISQQADIFLRMVSGHTNLFLDAISAYEQGMLNTIAKQQQNNRSLKSLAGSIAHEMRNPLAQIDQVLYLLQKEAPQCSDNQFLQNARRVIKSSFQLIEITLSAISEKPIDPAQFVLLSAQAVVEQAVRDYAYEQATDAEKITIKGDDFQLMAAPVMLKHVLYNLIHNALWYAKTPPHADITISLLPDQPEGAPCIEVRDTGPGIAADAIPQLFDSFYTADKQGGTGLGLSYCKRTMNALGGDIRCHSTLGEYTAFVLSFPVPATEKT